MNSEQLLNEYYKLEWAKDWKGAIEVLTKLIVYGENLTRYFYDRAGCYYKLCMWEEALRDDNSAILFFPEFDLAYKMRNRIFRRMKNYDAAFEELERFKRVISYIPNWVDYEYLMTKIDKGDLEEAMSDCKRLMRKSPGNSYLHLARAEGHLAGGNIKAAIMDFTKSYNLDTRNEKALERCALVRKCNGDMTGALKDYNTLIMGYRFNRAYFLTKKGELLIEMKRYIEAIDVFTTLNRISINPNYYFSRGICRIMVGAIESGLCDIRTAIKRDPANKHYKKALDDIKSSLGFYQVYTSLAYFQCRADMQKKE